MDTPRKGRSAVPQNSKGVTRNKWVRGWSRGCGQWGDGSSWIEFWTVPSHGSPPGQNTQAGRLRPWYHWVRQIEEGQTLSVRMVWEYPSFKCTCNSDMGLLNCCLKKCKIALSVWNKTPKRWPCCHIFPLMRCLQAWEVSGLKSYTIRAKLKKAPTESPERKPRRCAFKCQPGLEVTKLRI